MQPSTRLFLIRHGHTASNGGHPRPVMSGRTDLPLSERGLAQVERLRQYLASQPPFDAVYTSPLQRARATARACRTTADTCVCPGIQEIDCGAVDGLPIEQVQREHAAAWAENLAQTDDLFRWPGGETYAAFRARCLEAVRRIGAAHRGGRVAVVTHAGVISQILGWLGGVRPARWESFRPTNASITELIWRGEDSEVVCFDQHAYLGTLS